ncbi:hypothetical protein QL285_018038 [Trifolium repens]|nr:hypothetical protein QL285_018038 [Trifolium repens]
MRGKQREVMAGTGEQQSEVDGRRRRVELVGENMKQMDAAKDGGRNWWRESMGQALEKRERVKLTKKEEKS